MYVGRWGENGPLVLALHGGPAAVGEAAPIALGLAHLFRVLEPWQRGSGDEALTVARHVEDLHALVRSECGGVRPAIVGESWGAMLALAYAAAHPESAGPLVLVGCGTFDIASRARMHSILEQRTNEALRHQLELVARIQDPDERIRKQYEKTRLLYLFDPIDLVETMPPEAGHLDVRAYTETWEDMLRLQREGIYPAAFVAITQPVLMIHGAYDPHPGPMIRDSLLPYLPQLEYLELALCGHSPWLEKGARETFFKTLRDWLAARTAATTQVTVQPSRRSTSNGGN